MQGMVHRTLATRIERIVGAKVVAYRRVRGGYTPATRLLCGTATTRYFAKVGATDATRAYLRREMHVYERVAGPFMPRVIGWEDDPLEPLLVLEDLSSAHWPPPWDDGQVETVLAQIHTLHDTRATLEPYVQVHGARDSNWQAVDADAEPFLSLGLADERWLQRALPDLIRQEALCRTDGTSLTHCDLRSDNMCLAGGRAVFVDWNLACLSNPSLDLGFWLPSLAHEGGPDPERILPDAPEVAAWVAGFFAARAGLPDIVDAPRVRLVQRQQLATALPWAARALGLAPPGGQWTGHKQGSSSAPHERSPS
jgi:hypothetical protein